MRKAVLIETASAEKLAALLEDVVKAGVPDINPLETSIIDGLVAAVKKHKLGNVTGVKLNAIGISNALDKIAKAMKAAIKEYDDTGTSPAKADKASDKSEEADKGGEVEDDETSEDEDSEPEESDAGEEDEIDEEDDSEESSAGRKIRLILIEESARAEGELTADTLMLVTGKTLRQVLTGKITAKEAKAQIMKLLKSQDKFHPQDNKHTYAVNRGAKQVLNDPKFKSTVALVDLARQLSELK